MRERFLQILYADKRHTSPEQQILLWILLFSSFTFLLIAANNALLDIPAVHIPASMGLLCLAFYLLVRRNAALAPKVNFAPFLTYLLVATDSWFSNAGIEGSVPLFLICPIITAMILFKGWLRLWIFLILVAHLTGLTFVQQAYPASVLPYPSLTIKQIDMLTSSLFVAFYCIGYVIIVVHHLERRRLQTERLVRNLLPHTVAETLKYQCIGAQTVADYFPQASIMFINVVDFTALTTVMQPAELIIFLNELFSHFDMLTEAYGVEKIKASGNSYMVAAGVPQSRPDHAQVLVRMALTIQEHSKRQRFYGHKLSFRIGVNSGSVVAGIIGRQKFIYDLWGEAVNLANRMESQGQADVIQITRATYDLLHNNFICEAKEPIFVKGKGTMEVWHVKAIAEKKVDQNNDRLF